MKTGNIILLLIIAISLGSCTGSSNQESDSNITLIRNVSIIDGKGNPPQDGMDILIENDRITQIGKNIVEPSRTKEINGEGMSALPGLIDSHVHISSVPGSDYRNDSLNLFENLQRHHLKAYLACGITTILDTGIDPEEARKINKWLDNGQAGPRLQVLSPAFTATKGYASDFALGKFFFEPVTNPDDVINKLNKTADIHAKGVKIFLESGFGMERLPILSEDLRKTIVEQCKLRNLPLYIHCTTGKDAQLALDMEPLALVHGSALGGEELIRRLIEKPVHMISTLSIQDGFSIEYDRDRLTDPYYINTVPEIELQTSNNQGAWDSLSLKFAKVRLAETATEEEIKMLTQPWNPKAVLSIWMENIKKQHEAGIPIVMGSDAGNWPAMPHMFHGPTSVREIELLTLAGMTPLEAIRSSTSIPAKMLNMAEDIGSIEEGKIADIIIVDGNPSLDISTLKNVKWTIKGGAAKTPEQWME